MSRCIIMNYEARRAAKGKTMRQLMWAKVLVQNLKSKDGVTAIEYGLIAALIAVAIIVAVTLVGTNLQLTFNMIAGHLGSSPH